jgi:heme oxygenase
VSQTKSATAADVASSFLAQLRAETREAHLRMEALPSLSCLLAPDLTRSEYGFALRGLHRLHAGAAGRLDAKLAFFAGMPTFDNARLMALSEDLAWLGVTPGVKLGLAACLESAPAALGVLYVLEGSALGGRVIGKALRHSLDMQPGSGGNFFCGAPADTTRARWLHVSDALNRAGETLTPRERVRSVVAARGAFDALARALTPALASLLPTASGTSPATGGRESRERNGRDAKAAPRISCRPVETGRPTS